MNYLGQFSHPNLVKLIGYCFEDDYRLLVYEFMPRGSLENHLFRSEYCVFIFTKMLFVILKRNCYICCFRGFLFPTSFLESSP